jgi:hypothetical protein
MKKLLLMIVVLLALAVAGAMSEAELESTFQECPGWNDFEPALIEYAAAHNLEGLPFHAQMNAYLSTMHTLPDVEEWWLEYGHYEETCYEIKCMWIYWWLHTSKTRAEGTWCLNTSTLNTIRKPNYIPRQPYTRWAAMDESTSLKTI